MTVAHKHIITSTEIITGVIIDLLLKIPPKISIFGLNVHLLSVFISNSVWQAHFLPLENGAVKLFCKYNAYELRKS